MKPISPYEQEPAFAGVMKLIRDATVAFTNVEMNILNHPKAPPPLNAEWGAFGSVASPNEAKELKWLGFDMINRANNHATDYGTEGMLEMNRILDDVGLMHAGTGSSLAEARAPAYFQTPVGRVAMIATASTFTPISRAGHPRGETKARPGLSPLRWTREVYLDPAAYGSLKSAVASMNSIPTPNLFTDEQMNLFGTTFKKSNNNHVEYVVNETDTEEILAQVRSARRQADFVFVEIHAHESGNKNEVPADFLPRFAKAAIDAGADMFIGHGPHELRGIEIYKGRPIFYSLGSFIFHVHLIDYQSIEVYERRNLDVFRSTTADLHDALKGTSLEFKEDVWWESVIAVSQFEQGRLKAVELHPIDLGGAMPRSQQGTPRIADPTLSKKIIDRVARLSSPFGTKVRFERGIGIVELPTSNK
jgi:poly-gamma-glutamate synthesis protein (capsule biosynthesis protein)